MDTSVTEPVLVHLENSEDTTLVQASAESSSAAPEPSTQSRGVRPPLRPLRGPQRLLDIEQIRIPTLPEVVLRVSELVDDPKTGLMEIAQEIATDAPLSARLLRLANSATYAVREPVVDLGQAATLLGARALRNLVLQAAVLEMYQHVRSTPDLDTRLVWRHAIFVARTSERIARGAGLARRPSPQSSYTCGLLHDLGKMVLLDNLGDAYLDALREAREHALPAHVVEEELIGFTHQEIAARVARRWNLPEPLQEVLLYHHGPLERILEVPAVAVVALADQLCYRIQCGSVQQAAAATWPCARKLLAYDSIAYAELVEATALEWPKIDI
jgi:putative nucleotidyltransferase with HDIG domain